MSFAVQEAAGLLKLRGILNRKQLCEEMSVGPETIFVWEKKGMPTIREGRTILYDLDEVVEWMKRRSKRPAKR